MNWSSVKARADCGFEAGGQVVMTIAGQGLWGLREDLAGGGFGDRGDGLRPAGLWSGAELGAD